MPRNEINSDTKLEDNKPIEQELLESELRFREVLENSLSASYKRSLVTNTYDYLSPVFKKIAGYTQEEMNTMPLETVISMMHPDDIQVVRDGIVKAITELNGIANSVEYRFKHKSDNEYRWLKDEFVVMQDEQGQPVALIGSVSDITENKRIQTELAESKEQMALFVEHSPASLAMFDTEMRYIATSRRWMTDYNLGEQSIIGKTHYEVFPEMTQEWKDIHQRCLQGAIERKEEDSFTRLDGTMEWLKWEIRPWHKGSGEIGGIIMFTEVITGQKESELKFKNLVEKSLMGVYILQNGLLVYVNPSYCNMLGYSEEELLGIEANQLVYSEDMTIAFENRRKRVEDGVRDIHSELRFQRKDGTIIWVELNSTGTFYKGAKAVIGTVQDITERKKTEAAIKEQSEIFSAIIENANESILLLSPDLKVLQYNKTAKDSLTINRGKEIYTGADFKEFLHPTTENAFMSMFRAAVAGKYPEREMHLPNIHGEFFWLRSRMYPVYDTRQSLIGVTVLAENITEQKNEKHFHEQKLTEATIRAQEEERYEIGSELHDNVCQLLTASMMYIGLMKKSLQPEGHELYDYANKYIKLASSEIRNLSHRLAPAFSNEATLEDAFINLLSTFNSEKAFEISLCFTDAVKNQPLDNDIMLNLYRILQEQLRNILKHADATTISINVSATNDRIRMRTTDNGVGFDPKITKGGIGLANMNRRVQLFSGHIHINAAPGNGCEIIVDMPLPVTS